MMMTSEIIIKSFGPGDDLDKKNFSSDSESPQEAGKCRGCGACTGCTKCSQCGGGGCTGNCTGSCRGCKAKEE